MLEEGNLNSTARNSQLDLWKTVFSFSNVGFYLILNHNETYMNSKAEFLKTKRYLGVIETKYCLTHIAAFVATITAIIEDPT